MLERTERPAEVIIDIAETPYVKAREFIRQLKEGVREYEQKFPYGQSVVERYYLEILNLQLKYFKELVSSYRNLDEYEGPDSILLAMNGMVYELRMRIYANNPTSPLLLVFSKMLGETSTNLVLNEYNCFTNLPTLTITDFFAKERRAFRQAVRRFKRALLNASQNGYPNIATEGEKLLSEIQQEQREDNLKFYKTVLHTAADYIYAVIHHSDTAKELSAKFNELVAADPTGKPSIQRLIGAISLVMVGAGMIALSVLGNRFKDSIDTSIRNSGIITGGGVFLSGLVLFSFNRKRSITKKAENFDNATAKVSQFFSSQPNDLTESLLTQPERLTHDR